MPQSIESWEGLRLAYGVLFASAGALAFLIIGGFCYAGIIENGTRDDMKSRKVEPIFADVFIVSVLLVFANAVSLAAVLGILRPFY